MTKEVPMDTTLTQPAAGIAVSETKSVAQDDRERKAAQLKLFDAGGAKPSETRMEFVSRDKRKVWFTVELDPTDRWIKGAKVHFRGEAIIRGARHDDQEDDDGKITDSVLAHTAVVTDLIVTS